MPTFFKWLFIFILITASLLASIFMILESGAFYQRLYPNDYGFIQLGFLAAALNEIFMTIMAGVWLPGKTKNGEQKGHPMNLFFRFLLVILFLTTVGGASFNLIDQKIDLLHEDQLNQEVIAVLRSQVDDNQESLQTFVDQRQRTNSALAVRAQQATKEKLIDAIQQKAPEQTLWFEIIFIVALRFGVQLANLCSVWLAGWLYRRPVAIAPTIQTAAPAEKTPAPNLQIRTRPVSVQKQATEAPVKTLAKPPGYPVAAKTEKPPSKPVSTTTQWSESTQNEQIEQLCGKIQKLLANRNEGVSLLQLSQGLGIPLRMLEEIQSPRSQMDHFNAAELQTIYRKLKHLYEEQYAI